MSSVTWCRLPGNFASPFEQFRLFFANIFFFYPDAFQLDEVSVLFDFRFPGHCICFFSAGLQVLFAVMESLLILGKFPGLLQETVQRFGIIARLCGVKCFDFPAEKTAGGIRLVLRKKFVFRIAVRGKNIGTVPVEFNIFPIISEWPEDSGCIIPF